MSIKTTQRVVDTINNLNYKLEKKGKKMKKNAQFKIKKLSANDSNKSRKVYLYLTDCKFSKIVYYSRTLKNTIEMLYRNDNY